MEITIKFYGSLRQFGNSFTLKSVENVADALNGLYCQINGLRRTIQRGNFKVILSGKSFTLDNLEADLRDNDIDGKTLHIIPILAGAGKVFNFVVGAVLVVVGAYTSNPALVGAGIAMIAGGVAQMLTPPPDMPNNKRDEVEKKQSTSFSNLSNMSAQGRPVPLAYGRIRTGSLIIGKGADTIVVNLVQPSDRQPATAGFFGLKRRRQG